MFFIRSHSIHRWWIQRPPLAQWVNSLLTKFPGGIIILIFTRTKSGEEARFYILETIENNWSRDTLAFQIKSNLFQRQGKAVTNFKNILPTPQSDLAQQTIKVLIPRAGQGLKRALMVWMGRNSLRGLPGSSIKPYCR